MTATPHPTPDDTAAVRARGLTKTYGQGETRVHALRGIDLDLLQGQFTAIVGPRGAGKTTLLHCLSGLDQASGGTVTSAGTELGALDEDGLADFRRDHVGFVFQAFDLLPAITALQNIVLPLESAGHRLDDPLRQRAGRLADILGVADRLGHRPAELTAGQQQRVAIARALITEPDLLFADEPTGNLNHTASAEMLHHLRRAADELGQTIVLVTHERDTAAYADHVVTIRDGRIA